MKKNKKSVSKINLKNQIIGISAIVLSLIMAIVLYASTTVKAANTVNVLVVAADIAQGKKLTDEDIKVIDVCSYNLPGNILKHKEDAIGSYANMPMKAGDYFLSTKISKSSLGSDTQIASLDDGCMAISFTVKSQSAGVAYKLQANDIIRLYSYVDGSVEEHRELYYVKVLSVSDSNGAEVNGKQKDKDDTAVYSSITVSATPEQAKKIISLENAASIYTAFITRDIEMSEQLLGKQSTFLENEK